MTDQLMGLDIDNNGISKKSVHAYESAWLGRWTSVGIEAVQPSQNCLSLKEHVKCSIQSSFVGSEIVIGDSAIGEKCREVIHSEENLKENHGRKHGNEGLDVSPFPRVDVSQQRESIEATRIVQNTPSNGFQAYMRKEAASCFHEGDGSSSKAMTIRRPLSSSWIHSRQEKDLPAPSFLHKEKFSSTHKSNNPIQVKSERNPLDILCSMRNHAKIDAVEETPIEPYGFSQATDRRTDCNLSEDCQVFKESKVAMKLKGKMFSGFLDLFPRLDLRHREGVRLPSLGSSKDSEEGPRQLNVVKSSAVCESSAETDTLEMDNFQRIRLSGSTSPPSPKGQERKNRSAVPRIEIPDMNREPPLVPDAEKSMDRHGGEASTSETQSMNVEHFLSNTELQKERKRVWPDPEPCNTWVKRLKTSAPDSSRTGTKSMKIEEASSGEKVNGLFDRIIKCGVTDPKPKNGEPSTKFKNTKLGGQDISLLHPWIQRWCKNQAETSHQSAEKEVICAPETSKGTALEEIQKKQFPSIAAMALMGKALTGLSPSGLKKSGSLIIWNTRDLR